MKRIPASTEITQRIEEVLTGWEVGGHPLDNFVRLGARYMLQVAVEQEVEDYLGRAHYRRGSRRRNGWRNGYEPGKVIRTSNLLERTFGEGKRRTKVIPRFPTESACLRLLYATLITASQSWKGLRMCPEIWLEIELLRREAFGGRNRTVEEELVAV